MEYLVVVTDLGQSEAQILKVPANSKDAALEKAIIAVTGYPSTEYWQSEAEKDSLVSHLEVVDKIESLDDFLSKYRQGKSVEVLMKEAKDLYL